MLLLTLSDHVTFTVLRRHLFTNVCILLTIYLVIFHVSELYNRTDLTLELNIFILVFSLITFDFQTLLIMINATRSFWIRALVSSSVPPVLLILQICETACFLQRLPSYGDYVRAIRVNLHYISLVNFDVKSCLR